MGLLKKEEVPSNLKRSKSKEIIDVYINPFLDVIMWIALAIGCFWVGRATAGQKEIVANACKICDNAMRAGWMPSPEIIVNATNATTKILIG